MTKALRLTAHPVSRILCATSHETVGFLYQWNNGDRQPAWFGPRVRKVLYEPLAGADPGTGQDAPMPSQQEHGAEIQPAMRELYCGLT